MSLTESFRVQTWLHSDKDDMELSVVRAIGDRQYQELSKEVQNQLRHMLYEVDFEIMVNPLTGEYTILSVTNGDQVLVPQSNSLLQQ